MTIAVARASGRDAGAVAALVHRLLGEIHGGTPPAPLDRYARTGRRLLTEGDDYAALLARDGAQPVGVVTLATCASLYALGRFGVIAEFYVAPEWRSAGVGAALLRAAVAHARDRGWTRIEVGAPDVPRWARTVAFYTSNGLVEVGPRLKLPL